MTGISSKQQMHVNATIAWDYFDDLVFAALCPGPLVTSDLDAHLADMLPRDEVAGVVVRASEGAPTPEQREQLQRWFARKERAGAVLTSSVLARGGVTALRWFGLRISAFTPNDLDAALRFVGVQQAKLGAAHARLKRVIFTADSLERPGASRR